MAVFVYAEFNTMQFIDEAPIEAYAGDGGPGSRHFRREKFVPLGGPDGGDGGHGGSIVLVADRNCQTLLDFRFQTILRAEHGAGGGGNNRTGKSGEDLIVKVPIGTEIRSQEDDSLVLDLTHDGQRSVLLHGGRGGKGNAFFKSATNQAPEYAQPGEPGETGRFVLKLKLMADVGLIGMPNAGKSTLISRISAARPKIADYPFTTLVPNLGVVQMPGGGSFVVADIPGLIPGAAEGKGLGIRFLKHVERTKLLVHLIDPFALDDDGTPLDPLASYRAITAELEAFSPELAARPQIVALTKADTVPDLEPFRDPIGQFEELGIPCFAISSASGTGIETLVAMLAHRLSNARAEILDSQSS